MRDKEKANYIQDFLSASVLYEENEHIPRKVIVPGVLDRKK